MPDTADEYGFGGSAHCPDDSYPEAVPADTHGEFREGDLYLSFSDEVPPGVLFVLDGSWGAASFEAEGKNEYRIKGEGTETWNNYLESIAESPAEELTTCWPKSTALTSVAGPDSYPVEIPVSAAEKWEENGGEDGYFGRLVEPLEQVDGGFITYFENASYVLTPEGRAFLLLQDIHHAYRQAGGPAGDLGFPTSRGASYSSGYEWAVFEGGTITEIDDGAEVEKN